MENRKGLKIEENIYFIPYSCGLSLLICKKNNISISCTILFDYGLIQAFSSFLDAGKQHLIFLDIVKLSFAISNIFKMYGLRYIIYLNILYTLFLSWKIATAVTMCYGPLLLFLRNFIYINIHQIIFWNNIFQHDTKNIQRRKTHFIIKSLWKFFRASLQ